ERIAFSANREDPSRFDVYVQDLRGGAARLVQRGPGGYYSVAGWSPDDRSLLVSRGESNFNQDLYVLDVAGGQARRLTPHRGDAPLPAAGGRRDRGPDLRPRRRPAGPRLRRLAPQPGCPPARPAAGGGGPTPPGHALQPGRAAVRPVRGAGVDPLQDVRRP